MGPLFVILLWFIISLPLGFIAGLLYSYIVIPLYYRLLNVPEEKRRYKGSRKLIPTAIVAALFVFLVVGLNVLGFVMEIKDSDNYWESWGFADTFRMPLEYPYEISMGGVMDIAEIGIWKRPYDDIVREVTRYHKEGNIIVGEISPHHSERRWLTIKYENVGTKQTEEEYYIWQDSLKEHLSQFPEKTWFAFDCASGALNRYETHENYLEALDSLGFESVPDLLTIQENWRLYRSNPREAPEGFVDTMLEKR